MATIRSYRCNNCEFSFETRGPCEFTRDKQGRRCALPHPYHPDKDLGDPGIFGLSGELYCPECAKTFDVILCEFKEPTWDSLAMWGGACEPKEEYKNKDSAKCPKCKKADLLLELDENETYSCPRCGKEEIQEFLVMNT